MLDVFGQKLGELIGLRRSTLAVPILDGVFKPNSLLEEAEVLTEREGMEDMARTPEGQLLLACGSEVLACDVKGELSPVADHGRPITALAVLPDGRRAVALGDRIEIEGTAEPLREAAGRPFRAITALSLSRDGKLLICDASAERDTTHWQHDLMEKGASGRLVSLDPASGAVEVLQTGLQWAYGAWQGEDGGILVSESWRHRLLRTGKGTMGEMPGYPARITPTADGGFWLAVFAARMQIVEFVLSETEFRREMIATIEPEHWISPAYSSGKDFLEPLQGGGVKQMGILKPWAPPRSYGMAVRFDAHAVPVMSVHSRVGGENHGIVTVLERGEEVLALSKGAGRMLRLDAGAIRRANAIGGEDV
ncbi:hypothetical protein [Antarcticimicrobium luteum]|uniref:Strictosidine synthase conserved region domain-containing protein n=1 Tax=Antarcticimicrobium luteum TaxID=2547397 RepID=A0A4R5UQM9_9RHOB|nr:hypothetical protein [Antarcticimicrobium luteum]TDK41201.1 hypothetical protein E1832_21145 [Antarcticimicrobium luteum]